MSESNSSSVKASGNESTSLNELVPLIQRHVDALKKPGVVSIRPGYRMENGWPTKERAVVVIRSKDATGLSFPSELEGVKVDVREATPVEQMRHGEPERFAKLAAERPELVPGAFPEVDPVAEGAAAPQPTIAPAAAKPQIAYTPAPVPLQAVRGNLSFTCHASPDAGWPTLKQFLSQTQSRLTVGLYDWTSEHILNEVKKNFALGQVLKITLDNPALNPTADQSDSDTVKTLDQALGGSFEAAWALVRQNKDIARWIFPTAYHIKVAVRDGKSVWLSSGNWNNSNQPDIDPISNPQADDQQIARKSDRDWHVIVDNPDLAQTYEAYLKHDFDVADAVAPATGPGLQEVTPPEPVPAEFQVEARAAFHFFAPLRLENEAATITPLLTPDPGVYQEAMLKLIQSAENKLYIQLQYIHPSDSAQDASFTDLINAVVDRNSKGVDVRIILSQFQASHGWLERLQAAGIDLSTVKIQNGVHNKGFVVDSTTVALGSQNWSGDGVLRNRDASLIIENAKAAQYYENIFLHDWDNLARQSVRQ